MIWITGTIYVLCVIAATAIGARKQSAPLGFLAGVLFGPIGVGIMLAMKDTPPARVPADQRPKQPW